MSQQSTADNSEWYLTIGTILGAISALAAFLISWWYCAAEYGYLLGFGLGWLPSVILAAIIYFAVRYLWGLPAVLVVLALLGQLN
jgi:hypothetical protein